MIGRAAKIGVVAGGYAAAIAVASAAVAIHVALTNGPDAQAASGMYAFGDAVLFVAIFGVIALFPTAAALFFLRPYRLFWVILSGLVLAVAATGVAGAVLFALGRHLDRSSPLGVWAAFSVLRILIAPLLALSSALIACLSPYRLPRLACLVAFAMESAVSAYGGIVWFVPLFFSN